VEADTAVTVTRRYQLLGRACVTVTNRHHQRPGPNFRYRHLPLPVVAHSSAVGMLLVDGWRLAADGCRRHMLMAGRLDVLS
jgi:hypothetical protein